jgi:hypothetical protein
LQMVSQPSIRSMKVYPHRVFNRIRTKISKPKLRSSLHFSDRKFLSQFFIPKVSSLVSAGNLTEAKAALIDYYRHKILSSWLMPPKTVTDLRMDTSQMTASALLKEAEALLQFKFSPEGSLPKIKPDGSIDWDFNPVSSREWILRLHRHQWWTIFGLAYAESGDERFARAFVSQLLSWIAGNPLPSFKNEKSHAWRLMETGLRLRASWIPSFALFYDSPHFTDEAKLKMMRSIFDHAQFLFHFKTNRNHLLRESNGLAYASVYFSEFRDAGIWLPKALDRIDREIRNQVNRDGSHIEMSTGYQWLVVDELENTLDLLRVNHMSLPHEDLQQWLEKMYYVLANLMRPDGSFPELNDGFIRWEKSRLIEAGKKLGREDFVYIGTTGQYGKAPQNTSIGFEDAGLYVMRSDWTGQGRYLIFDAGPYGGPHGHEDKLSFELFACGKPFIVDSGSYTYQKSDAFRSYFVGSQGHNAVLVDGMSQVRRWNQKNLNPKPVSGNHAFWISRDGFDYVESSYSDGYGNFSFQKSKNAELITDVTHTRRILFVKPDYWIVIDEMLAEENHDYQMLFHTLPEINVNLKEDNLIEFVASENGARLCLLPEEPTSWDVSILKGSEAPIQGWYSIDHHKKCPAAAVIFSRQRIGAVTWTTLLYPFPADQKSGEPVIRRLQVSGGNCQAFAVGGPAGVDYLMVSDDNQKKQFGRFESDEKITVVRTDKNGEIINRFGDGSKQ